MRYLLILLLAGCGTTVNMRVPQPTLQTLNLGQPNCSWECHTTHTATQSTGPGDYSFIFLTILIVGSDKKTRRTGPGDVQGAAVSNTNDRSRSTSIGSGQ